jgi:hypothetical protein
MNYDRAAAMFKRFNGYAPRRVKCTDVKLADGQTSAMVFLGKAAEIKYVSDKDLGRGRKQRGYVHRFGRKATLWATEVRENGKKCTALVVRDGIKITSKGIEG